MGRQKRRSLTIPQPGERLTEWQGILDVVGVVTDVGLGAPGR
jgi:hypothetical protein